MFYPAAAKNICLPCAVILVLVISQPCALGQGAGYWHTAGSQILDSNNQTVRIAGVNWYGFETTDEIAHGLWAQDYHTILSEIKSNGFNIIRIPFSNQMVETPEIPTNFSQNNGQPINTDLVGLNSLQILDKIVTAAGADGLRVILDNHRSEAGNSNESNGLWYTSSYPESAWINDWKTLAIRYQSFTDASGNPIVIGMDLRNEPHLLVSGSNTGASGRGTRAQAAARQRIARKTGLPRQPAPPMQFRLSIQTCLFSWKGTTAIAVPVAGKAATWKACHPTP